MGIHLYISNFLSYVCDFQLEFESLFYLTKGILKIDSKTCSGYYQRKSFGFSPEEPGARRSALESARYRSQGHRPSSFLC